jgi:RNA polymerase sigma-70 factor (ECF subfamily)
MTTEITARCAQITLLRLHRALAAVHPMTPAEFNGLAATQIRRELLDLAKRFNGPHGVAANHHSDSGPMINGQRSLNAEPEDIEAWARFHEAVDSLPEDQRKAVELLWYEGLSQPEAAVLLEVSLATVKRRWAAARLTLCESVEEWVMD